MANEIRIPIIGEDRASGPMRDVGRSADIAALGARRLADALDAQARAADAAAKADLSVAKANAILAVTEHKMNAERAAVTQKLQRSIDDASRRRAGGRALISGSAFRGLFSGGAGGAGQAAGQAVAGGAGQGGAAASPLLDFLGSPAGIGGAVAAAPSAVALIDAVLGQGLGTGVGAAGAGLVALFNPAVLAPGLTNIKKTLSTVAQSIGPSLGLMLAQFGKFVQGLAPVLAKLFSASLPFMKQFFTLLEVGAKTILPALTTVLKQMVSSGALQAMTQGLVFLIQAIASLIVHIGPGLKAGALVFRAIMIGLRDAVYIFADAWGFLGKVAGKEYSFLRSAWDNFRHWFASSFDAWRHWWASSWFQAWDTVVKIWHAIVDAASSAWRLLVNAAKTGIASIVTYFTGLPSRVIRALAGLGSKLWQLGAGWITSMWSGIKHIWGSVLSWFENLPSAILHAIGIHSPPNWAISAGQHIMQGLHIGLKKGSGQPLGLLGSIAQQIGLGAASGGLHGSVVSWITTALRLAHKPLSWLPALERLVSLESGGNPRAVNPTPVLGEHASGLWQMLPSTFAGYGGVGSLFNPIIEGVAALRYISAVYGSPYGIPGLFSGGYRGYAFGTSSAAPGWAWVGERGPELVRFRGGERVSAAGGTTVYLTVQVGHGTHPVAAAQEIVKLLNVGARNGVRLRSSILGPG